MINGQDVQNNGSAAEKPLTARRKYPWAMLVVAGVFVMAMFLSWYGSWFGRELSDSKLEEYLNDTEKPRHVQHALAQIGNKLMEGDQTVKRWYPAVIAASGHPLPEIRLMAAWVMGQDNTAQEFHTALVPMLKDPDPGARHNAALALVRFNDTAARPELVDMLKPYTLRAEAAGSVEFFVKEEGVPVAKGAPLVRIKQGGGQITETRAAEDGRVDMLMAQDGATVEAGAELMELSPSTEQVYQALRALYLIGQPDDIPHIQRYTRPISGMPDRVQKQAAAALEAIRARAEKR